MNQERRNQIAELVAQKHTIKNAELMERFGISIETVRRDLEYLEQQEPSKEISAKISNFRLRYATTGLKLDAMRRRLKLLREERFDLSQCRLCCQVVYPKAKISIGSDTITVSNLETQCNVHLSKKGIQLR